MNLYLDDDSVDRILIRLLQRAGHHVEVPADVDLSGEDDPVHLAHAIETNRIFFTFNHKDFWNLHNLVAIADGHHPGILVVRKDDDSNRDMKQHAIVIAISNLVEAGVELPNGFFILNQWR